MKAPDVLETHRKICIYFYMGLDFLFCRSVNEWRIPCLETSYEAWYHSIGTGFWNAGSAHRM